MYTQSQVAVLSRPHHSGGHNLHYFLKRTRPEREILAIDNKSASTHHRQWSSTQRYRVHPSVTLRQQERAKGDMEVVAVDVKSISNTASLKKDRDAHCTASQI